MDSKYSKTAKNVNEIESKVVSICNAEFVKYSLPCPLAYVRKRNSRYYGQTFYKRSTGELLGIRINLSHLKYRQTVHILDTIKHEIAHAIEVLQYGYCTHGHNWKELCKVTGALPNQYAKY